ncbi:MAG TPA: septum formation initiator family protein [Rhodothermales bacterium]
MTVRRRNTSGRRIQKWFLLVSLIVVGVWIGFFDSHSIARRVAWHHEAKELAAANDTLRADIARLEEQLQEARTDEMVEKIAREQYGMRRPGERVYRVETVEP